MMESIITAIITGGLALCGVVISNLSNNKKIEAQLMTNQAVTNAKIENLTEELKKTALFGDRITRLETKVELLERSEKA
jgi:outer membrane murein-binding lipoprotein Lpp